MLFVRFIHSCLRLYKTKRAVTTLAPHCSCRCVLLMLLLVLHPIHVVLLLMYHHNLSRLLADGPPSPLKLLMKHGSSPCTQIFYTIQQSKSLHTRNCLVHDLRQYERSKRAVITFLFYFVRHFVVCTALCCCTPMYH